MAHCAGTSLYLRRNLLLHWQPDGSYYYSLFALALAAWRFCLGVLWTSPGMAFLFKKPEDAGDQVAKQHEKLKGYHELVRVSSLHLFASINRGRGGSPSPL